MSQTKLNVEQIRSQLHTLQSDIQRLSDKKPNDNINEFKLKFINLTLEKCNELLGNSRPYESFTTFDTDMLPTNSDVMIILDLYYDAMYEL